MNRSVRPTTTLAVLLGAFAIAPAASAHHAFSAEFDADLPIRVQGKIVQVDWINPHAWVHVEHENEDGTTQVWMLEAGTPNTLLRRGMTRKLLQPGMEVVVRGYQSKDRICEPICAGSGRDITFPDGRKFFMGSSGTGAPRDGADPNEPARETESSLPEESTPSAEEE